MKYLHSFSRERVFALFTILISTLLFFAVAEAQELKESSASDRIIVTSPTMEMLPQGDGFVFRSEIINENEGFFDDLYFGIKVLKREGEQLTILDAHSGGMVNLKPSSQILATVTYEVPHWLSGEYEVEFVLEDILGNQVAANSINSVSFENPPSSIEINPDSCSVSNEDTKTNVSCIATNKTTELLELKTNYVGYTPTYLGDQTNPIESETAVTLQPNTTTNVIFSLRTEDIENNSAVALWLGTGEASSNKVFFMNSDLELLKTEVVEIPTRTESNTTLVFIATLLALIVLTMVVIYLRKQKEPLEEMKAPEGTIN